MTNKPVHCIYIPPTQLPDLFKEGWVEKGLQKCVTKGGLGLNTEEEIRAELLTGNWGLWTIVYVDELVGFYVLRVRPYRYGEILFGYLNCLPHDSYYIRERALEELENTCRAYRCKKVLAYSTRTGMDTILSEKLGYDKNMIVYCKELHNEPPQKSSSN